MVSIHFCLFSLSILIKKKFNQWELWYHVLDSFISNGYLNSPHNLVTATRVEMVKRKLFGAYSPSWPSSILQSEVIVLQTAVIYGKLLAHGGTPNFLLVPCFCPCSSH